MRGGGRAVATERRLSDGERMAVATLLALLAHLFLYLFLELSVRIEWPHPRSYLGSVTVELEAETEPVRLEPGVTATPTPAPSRVTSAEPTVAEPAVAEPTVAPASPEPITRVVASEPVRTAPPAQRPAATAAPTAAPPRPAATAAPTAAPQIPATRTAEVPRASQPPAQTGEDVRPPSSGAQQPTVSREPVSSGAERAPVSVPEAPSGVQAASQAAPVEEVAAPFSLPPRASETSAPSSEPTPETRIERSSRGAVGGAVAPSTGEPDYVAAVAGGSGSTGAVGVAVPSPTGGAAAVQPQPLPLADIERGYALRADELTRRNRGLIRYVAPNLRGLEVTSRVQVEFTFQVASSGFVMDPGRPRRGSPSAEIDQALRVALSQWQFTPAPEGTPMVEASVTFTLVPTPRS